MRTSDYSPARIRDGSDFDNETTLFNNHTLNIFHPTHKKVIKPNFQQLLRDNTFNLDNEFLKAAYQNPNVQNEGIGKSDGIVNPNKHSKIGLDGIFKTSRAFSLRSLLELPVKHIQSVLRSYNPNGNVSTQPLAETDDNDYSTTQCGNIGSKKNDNALLYLKILERLKSINEKLEETPVCQESNISSDVYNVNDITSRPPDAKQRTQPASTDSSITTNVYVNNLYNLVESDRAKKPTVRVDDGPTIDEHTLALLQQVISQLDGRLQLSFRQVPEHTDSTSNIEYNARNRISCNQICKEFLKHVDTPTTLEKGSITSGIYFKLGFPNTKNPDLRPDELYGKLDTPLRNLSTDLLKDISSFKGRRRNDMSSSSKEILRNAVSCASELETITEVSPWKEISHTPEVKIKSEKSERPVRYTGSFMKNTNRYDIDLIEKEYNSEMSSFSPQPKTKDHENQTIPSTHLIEKEYISESSSLSQQPDTKSPKKQNNPSIELRVGKATAMDIIEKTYALLGTQPIGIGEKIVTPKTTIPVKTIIPIGKMIVTPKTPITIEENKIITITSPKKQRGSKDKLANTLPNYEKCQNSQKASLALARSESDNGAIKIQTTAVGVTRCGDPTSQKKSVKTADNVFLYRWK